MASWLDDAEEADRYAVPTGPAAPLIEADVATAAVRRHPAPAAFVTARSALLRRHNINE
ncbi:hypothetical protein [Streptomyces sp. NPDC058773]|uniref:hypothetical protein n=1 Tax=Streptomyces sp. NPDC058773 TaxID=3346632 RepID=UPI0036B47E2C